MRFLRVARNICWDYRDWKTATRRIVPASSEPQDRETHRCIPLLGSDLYKERLRDFPGAAKGPWLAVWNTESVARKVLRAAVAAYGAMATDADSGWPSSSSSSSSLSHGLQLWDHRAVKLDVGSLFPSTMLGGADSTEGTDEAHSTALDLWRRIMKSDCVTGEPGELPTRRCAAAAVPRDPT